MVRSKNSLAAVVLALVMAIPSSAVAAPRPDADYTEAYFSSGDGSTTLHADILRPKGLRKTARTPVILTVSPYFIHGDMADPSDPGPNERFYDFLNVTDILAQGYTYVMVDLPGFGGSGGCNDWGGLREQGAVKAAVEWAASQRWSTGRVGLMGKSYDAWTGLMGIAQAPKGLAAVVAMEPVYSGYRYLYSDGVRFSNSVGTPLIFQAYDAQPGSLASTPQYQVNGAPQAWCYGTNFAMQQQDDPGAAFWRERDLLAKTVGRKTPLFLTQGFLETNTKPDGAFDFFNRLGGPNRAWFGQFDHVRGWEQAGEFYLTGREVFVKEMMRFLGHYVKGVPRAKAPVHRDPTVAVQDNLGRYRPERRWPPADARLWWNRLNIGTYPDDGLNNGTGGRINGRGVWSFSQPVRHDVWMTGEPVLDVTVDTPLPRANLVANIYDVSRDGEAVLVSRGARLLRDAGEQGVRFELYGQDWLLRRGHRLGILVSGANAEWWVHAPTGVTVTVRAAKVGLPFLTYRRTRFIDGEATTRLEEHLSAAVVTVAPATVRQSTRAFRLPPPMKERR